MLIKILLGILVVFIIYRVLVYLFACGLLFKEMEE